MAHSDYYETGDNVPTDGNYKTFCDNALAILQANEQFPPCPACHQAASWRKTS